MSDDIVVRALQDFSRYSGGGFLSGITLWSPKRQEGSTKIIGPAYTVKYIDSVPSGSIIFISAPPMIVNAVYGGLMSTRARYLNAAGTIVDGRIRDLQEHRELNYPVFARDVGTTGPQELLHVGEINTPVQLQNEDQAAIIHPGDYLIADLNGVVLLPKHLAQRAIELLISQVEADERVAEDLKRGRAFSEAAKEHRASVKMPSKSKLLDEV
ncbi:hypothetical protein MMC29_006819 [Sticta canariensis]|nr:hypothetical protein [Sticta canariensis]